MTVENATYINNLNKAYPRNRDLIKEGDDHIRLIKATLQSTFPGMDGSVNAGTDKLNKLDATFTYDDSTLKINSNFEVKENTEVDFGGNKITNIGDPEEDTDAVSLKYLRGSAMWPVGSIFMTISSDNPNTILGFGKWEAFAQGRVIIGSGTTTDAANETRIFKNETKGGQYAVKLTEKNTPPHSHEKGTLAISDSGEHDHTVDLRVHDYAVVNSNSWTVPNGDIAGEDKRFRNTIGAKTTKGSGKHSHTLSGSTASFGNGEAFDVVSPYIVCNIWVRKPD